MKKNALFLTLLCLICTKHSYAQNEIGFNIYDMSYNKAFELQTPYQDIGIKTTDLHFGTEHQATAIVDMYLLEFSNETLPHTDWQEQDHLHLFSFRTIKEPPLRDYSTFYQNISSGIKTLKSSECMDLFEEDCLSFMWGTKLEYESNNTMIFQNKLVLIAKRLNNLGADGNFNSFKEMLIKVKVVLERKFFRNGTPIIVSTRLPGVQEIKDLTPFLYTNKLKVYPNPSSNGEFNMLLTNVQTVHQIQYTVKNSYGEIIIDKTIPTPFEIENQSMQINPNQPLPPGMYYLEVFTGSHYLRRSLLVVGNSEL